MTIGRPFQGSLFADAAAKQRANEVAEGSARYEHGETVVESKRWLRPLDRRSGRRGEESAPSTQMLRYLRRIDDLTTGKLRWGILTNGAHWRLYYAGARSGLAEYACRSCHRLTARRNWQDFPIISGT